MEPATPSATPSDSTTSVPLEKENQPENAEKTESSESTEKKEQENTDKNEPESEGMLSNYGHSTGSL